MTYPSTELLIDGQWRPALDGKTIPVVNPAAERKSAGSRRPGPPISTRRSPRRKRVSSPGARFPPSTVARSCARPPTSCGPARRDRDQPDQEQGKPFVEAPMETLAAADIIDWFADEGMRV